MVTKSRFMLITTCLSFFLIGNGCTKKRKKNEVVKRDVLAKSIIDTETDYLFVASIVDTPMRSSTARPYWQGQEEIVKFRFMENSLEVFKPEQDERFSENELNGVPVLSIPVDHLAYTCVEDAYGKCTNNEKADSDQEWEQRPFFKADFAGLNSLKLQILPIELEKAFGSSCFSEVKATLVKSSVEEDAINFQVDRTFKQSLECVETLDETSFVVRYHYSLVKLQTLVTPGYQTVNYPREDENTFGFFTTGGSKLDVDYMERQSSEYNYMSRWADTREKIVYYLSDSFNRPEYTKIKAATYKAVDSINEGLAKAKAKFQIELREPAGIDSGDLRYNTIILVHDPIKAGLLGYGPSVQNPRTGETVQARTVMYPGVMTKFVGSAWDDLVAELVQNDSNQELADSIGTQISTFAAEQNNGYGLGEAILADISPVAKGDEDSETKTLSWLERQRQVLGQKTDFVSFTGQQNALPVADLTQVNELKATQDYHAHPHQHEAGHEDHLDQDLMAIYAKHNAYPSEYFNFKAIMKDKIKDRNYLRPWEELSQDIRQEIIEEFLPIVWVPTFIHEMGHNLGLRHNFMGSFDSENFYRNDAGEVASPFSSVMDYGFDELESLFTFGSYDIAALRFGYAREVESEEGGDFTKVKTTLADLLKRGGKYKNYSFCTDGGVGANPSCNRFDRGTTLPEIAQHLVDSYENAYKRRNFRNNRLNFSSVDDDRYSYARLRTFRNMRLFYERYEQIATKYNLPDDHPYWKESPYLKEIKDSVVIVNEAMLKVAVTPGITCAIAQVDQPEKIILLIPLSDISADAYSCFDQDLQLRDTLVVVAQGGKSVVNRKSPDNPSSYIDQIDIRGIWADKLAAIHYLFANQIGYFFDTDATGNMLQRSLEAESKIINAMTNIALDDVITDVNWQLADGTEFTAVTPVTKLGSDMIPKPLNSKVAKIWNLPNEATSFSSAMTKVIKEGIANGGANIVNQNIDSFFSASSDYLNGRDYDLQAIRIQGQRVYVAPENLLATGILNALQKIGQYEQSVAVKEETGSSEDAVADESEEALATDKEEDSVDDDITQRIESSPLFPFLLQERLNPERLENLLIDLTK